MRIIPTPRFRIEPARNSRVIPWWSLHTHSRYSTNDAMATVEAMVAKVAALGQPAMGLQDHGNMAGSVELYQACMKAGIKPFPGSELYFVPDTNVVPGGALVQA